MMADHYKLMIDRVLLPIKWTAYHIQYGYGKNNAALTLLQSYVDSLPRDKKYFTIVQYDDGPLVDFPFDCKVFAAGGLPDSAVPIPLICDPHTVDVTTKRIPISFIANVDTHPIRKSIAKTMYGKEYCHIGRHASVQFAEKTAESHFAICPRGYGKTSFRLYEAIQLGTIPVYISDKFWLPYSDRLDWSKFCVLHEGTDNLEGLMHDLYRLIGTEKYYDMMENLKAVRSLFTYEGTFGAICGILEREYENKNV